MAQFLVPVIRGSHSDTIDIVVIERLRLNIDGDLNMKAAGTSRSISRADFVMRNIFPNIHRFLRADVTVSNSSENSLRELANNPGTGYHVSNEIVGSRFTKHFIAETPRSSRTPSYLNKTKIPSICLRRQFVRRCWMQRGNRPGTKGRRRTASKVNSLVETSAN